MVFMFFASLMEEEQGDFVMNLYEKYGKLIYIIAYKHLHNHHDSEDVLQNVMMKIISQCEILRGKSEKEIISLIVIYAQNAAKDVYRKNQRHNNRETQVGVTDNEDNGIANDVPDPKMNVEDIIITNETIAITQKALLKLNETDQEIITLRLLENLSVREVAKALNITENAVNLRYRKAKERLLRLVMEEM